MENFLEFIDSIFEKFTKNSMDLIAKEKLSTFKNDITNIYFSERNNYENEFKQEKTELQNRLFLLSEKIDKEIEFNKNRENQIEKEIEYKVLEKLKENELIYKEKECKLINIINQNEELLRKEQENSETFIIKTQKNELKLEKQIKTLEKEKNEIENSFFQQQKINKKNEIPEISNNSISHNFSNIDFNNMINEKTNEIDQENKILKQKINILTQENNIKNSQILKYSQENQELNLIILEKTENIEKITLEFYQKLKQQEENFFEEKKQWEIKLIEEKMKNSNVSQTYSPISKEFELKIEPCDFRLESYDGESPLFLKNEKSSKINSCNHIKKNLDFERNKSKECIVSNSIIEDLKEENAKSPINNNIKEETNNFNKTNVVFKKNIKFNFDNNIIEKENLELKTQIDSLNKLIEELKINKNTLQNQFESSLKEINNFKNIIKTAENLINFLKSEQNNEKQKNLDKINNFILENSVLKHKMKTLIESYEKIKEQNINNENKINFLNKKIKENNEIIKNKELLIENLQFEIKKKKNEFKLLNEENNKFNISLAKENKELKDSIKNLEKSQLNSSNFFKEKITNKTETNKGNNFLNENKYLKIITNYKNNLNPKKNYNSFNSEKEIIYIEDENQNIRKKEKKKSQFYFYYLKKESFSESELHKEIIRLENIVIQHKLDMINERKNYQKELKKSEETLFDYKIKYAQIALDKDYFYLKYKSLLNDIERNSI